eukprot:gene7393-9084_t
MNNFDYMPNYGDTSPSRKRVSSKLHNTPSLYSYKKTPLTNGTSFMNRLNNSNYQSTTTISNSHQHQHQRHNNINSISFDEDQYTSSDIDHIQFDDDNNYNYSNNSNNSNKTTNKYNFQTNDTLNKRQPQQQQQQQQQQQPLTSSSLNNTSSINDISHLSQSHPNPRKLKESRPVLSSETHSNRNLLTSLKNIVTYPFTLISKAFLWFDFTIFRWFKGPINTQKERKGEIGYKCKNIGWVIFIATLVIFGVLGFFSQSTPFIISNTTTSNTKLDRDTLYPLLDEYLKVKGYEKTKTFDKLIEKLENDIQLLREFDKQQQQKQQDHTQIELKDNKNIKEIQEQIIQLKKLIISETTVRELVEKYSENDSMKNELRQLLSKLLEELKSVSDQQLQELKNQYNVQTLKIQSHANKVIDEQSDKINQLVNKLNSNTDDQVTTLSNEYQAISNRLEKLSNQLSTSFSDQISKLSVQQQQNISKEIQLQVNQESTKLNQLFITIKQNLESIQNYINENPDIQSISNSVSSLEQLRDMIDDALEIYSADKIAKPDYALYSGGGTIAYNLEHYKISPTYPSPNRDWLGLATRWIIPTPKPNPPEIIIEPTVNTGSCWGFYGGNGTVAVKLSQPIKPSEVTLEHINSKISHHIESSPQEFKVFGLKNTTDIGLELGTFTYDINKNRHLQTFKLNNENEETFSHIVFKVLSNYGYRYTCIYRFRVHGVPSPLPSSTQKQQQVEESTISNTLNSDSFYDGLN